MSGHLVAGLLPWEHSDRKHFLLWNSQLSSTAESPWLHKPVVSKHLPPCVKHVRLNLLLHLDLQSFIRFVCSIVRLTSHGTRCGTATSHLAPWCNIVNKNVSKRFSDQLFEATTPSGNPSKSKQQILLRFSPLYCFLMSLIHTAAMFWFKIAATSCEAKMYRHSMDFCEIWNTQSCAKEHHWHCRSEGSS